jgi:hypothetical protein
LLVVLVLATHGAEAEAVLVQPVLQRMPEELAVLVYPPLLLAHL